MEKGEKHPPIMLGLKFVHWLHFTSQRNKYTSTVFGNPGTYF